MFRTIQVAKYAQSLQQHYGIKPAILLADTGINPAELSSSNALISLEQYSLVVANMYRLTKDPAVAFTVARTVKVSDFGLVGYAMLSARTLKEATDIWSKYSNSLVGQYVQTAWGNDNDVSFTSPTNTGMLHQFETEQSIVRGRSIVSNLTGTKPVFKNIEFSYSQPAHVLLYEKVMQCPLTFDAPKTVVHFTYPLFDTPVKTNNEEIFSICAENCSKVMELLPGSSDLLNQLRKLFFSRPGQLPDIYESGSKLGMSPSTLLRKLESSGYSYQSIKDEFRFDLAREYLHSEHLAPKQIAYLLGFSSPSNFRRAFKTWSGMTISDFLLTRKR